MGNIVKFSTPVSANSIKSGGFNIGVNGTPADLTGFYTGICPVNGGYTIYIDKVSDGPSIYAPQNDTDLVNITKTLGGNVSTAVEALVWINSQSNMTVVNSNYPSIVTSGLVLNLDAGFVSSYPKGGTGWSDLSGNGNNGTLINGPTFSGGSIVFDGVNDYVNLPSSTNLWSGSFSINFFIKSNVTANQFIFSNGTYGTAATNIWFGGGNNTNFTIFIRRADGTGAIGYNFTTPLPYTDLNYYTIVYNVIDGTLKLYQNSSLVESKNTSLIDPSWMPNGWRIGNTSGSFNLNGIIPQFGVYNRALTPQEVLQNYYAGLQRFIPTDGLVLSLDAQNTNLYATSPTTAYDISGNYNNGSLINGVQYVGNGDGSWGFDGVDDYINIPNTASLQVTGDQTLVFWVYPERGVGRQNFYAKAYAGEGTITYESNGSMNYYYGTAGNDGSPYQGVNSGVVMATLNTWYFVVLVRELSTPTKTIKWYINAVLRNTTTATYSSATAGSYPITIGTGYAGRFLGKVGLVYQYNKALTQTEITTIFNATRTRYGI
jgi:hypothetical protein